MLSFLAAAAPCFQAACPDRSETAANSSSRAALSRSAGNTASAARSYIRRTLPKIRLQDGPDVRRELRNFTTKSRAFVEDGLSRRADYLPFIESVLINRKLPLELSNIAFIESRYLYNARSPSGAVGMWQFMKTTARAYGLRVSLFTDDRKNVAKSTRAAARYFSELYERFDDWILAVAAYNAGPTRIGKAIKRCGAIEFFALARCGELREETREFVARFIALSIILRHPEDYGFDLRSDFQKMSGLPR